MIHNLGWLVLSLGLALPVWALVRTRLVARQVKWVKVPGVVQKSQVWYDGELYRADVQYEYSYNAASIKGTNVRTNSLQFNWRGPADRTVARYPAGARVSVFVDPQDPARSVLEPGGDIRVIPFTFAVGALMILIGFALAFSKG